jgi:hypothetical protein
MLTVESFVASTTRCEKCKGSGIERRDRSVDSKYANTSCKFNCPDCKGSGFSREPLYGSLDDDGVPFRPGSIEKVEAMAARYRAGLPLWHDNDAQDQTDQELGEPQLGDDLAAAMLSADFDDEKD